MAIVNQIKATSTNETRDIHDYRLSEDNGTIKTTENIETSGDLKSATLESTGNAKLFENIVDADGHKRFIEGEITPVSLEGITFSFGGWSLSGSHLMLVLAGKIDENTEIDFYNLGDTLNLPAWILDKIYPSGDSANIVSVKRAELWEDNVNESANKLYCGLVKTTNGLRIATWNQPSQTFTADTYFRIAFDLFID